MNDGKETYKTIYIDHCQDSRFFDHSYFPRLSQHRYTYHVHRSIQIGKLDSEAVHTLRTDVFLRPNIDLHNYPSLDMWWQIPNVMTTCVPRTELLLISHQ